MLWVIKRRVARYKETLHVVKNLTGHVAKSRDDILNAYIECKRSLLKIKEATNPEENEPERKVSE